MMKKVNIIYDDEFQDVDIIAIPDDIFGDVDKLGALFIQWVIESAPKDDRDYWSIKNGEYLLIIETIGLVKWLNNHYCKNGSKAYIVEQHTSYCSEYQSIEF